VIFYTGSLLLFRTVERKGRKKDDRIAELKERVRELQDEVAFLRRRVEELTPLALPRPRRWLAATFER
jgi:hypothetical protein